MMTDPHYYIWRVVTIVIIDPAPVCNLFVLDDLFVLYVYVYTYDGGSNSLSLWHGVNVFHREYYVVVSYTLMKCSLQPSPQPLYVWCVNKSITSVCPSQDEW